MLIDWRGCFVNLDRATDRLRRMEESLKAAGIAEKMVRFPANTDSGASSQNINPGAIGCFLSHRNIFASVEEAANSSFAMLVVEDDAIVTSQLDRVLGALLGTLNSQEWDILFLNQVMDLSQYFRIRELLKLKKQLGSIHSSDYSKFSLVPAQALYSAGTGAYLINPKNAGSVRELLDQEIEQGFRVPIDTYFRNCIFQGYLKALVLFPFLVGLTNEESQIDAFGKNAEKDPSSLFSTLTNLFVATDDLRNGAHAGRIAMESDLDTVLGLYRQGLSSGGT